MISSELFDRVYDSSGNYILVRLYSHTKSNFNLSESLVSNHSIYIKDVSSKIIDSSYKYYRFAVRLPHENSQLIQAISDCLQSDAYYLTSFYVFTAHFLFSYLIDLSVQYLLFLQVNLLSVHLSNNEI